MKRMFIASAIAFVVASCTPAFADSVPGGTGGNPIRLCTGGEGGVYVNTEAFQDKAKLTKLVTAVSRAAVNIKAEYGK